MTLTPLKTLVVGFGRIADTNTDDPLMAKYFQYSSHAQILSAHPSFDWIAVVDPSAEARARAKKKWNVTEVQPYMTDLRSPESIEVAIISTPPSARHGIIEQLPNLKAILVEKPLGTSLNESKAFLEECYKRDILVQVNFWRRGVPLFQSLSNGLLHDKIGALQTAFISYGNGLQNNGSHMIDFIEMLCGKIIRVMALAEPSKSKNLPIPGDIQMPLALTLESGQVITMHPLDYKHYREAAIDLWGEKGRLSLYIESLVLQEFPLDSNRGVIDACEIKSDAGTIENINVSEAYIKLYSNLIQALNKSELLLSPSYLATKTELVINAAIQSGQNNGLAIDTSLNIN